MNLACFMLLGDIFVAWQLGCASFRSEAIQFLWREGGG